MATPASVHREGPIADGRCWVKVYEDGNPKPVWGAKARDFTTYQIHGTPCFQVQDMEGLVSQFFGHQYRTQVSWISGGYQSFRKEVIEYATRKTQMADGNVTEGPWGAS